VSFDEVFLLDGNEFDHGKLFVGVGEGGEDFSGDTEVGVVHVLALFGFGEAESDAAEVGGSGWHGAFLRESMSARVGRRDKREKRDCRPKVQKREEAGLKPALRKQEQRKKTQTG
jgi:hypothetical protein